MNEATRMASVPREVRLTAGGKAIAGLAAVSVAAALAAAMGLTILHQRQDGARQTRMREGIHTEGTVVRVARTRGEHPRTVVTYRYATPDGEREHTARLTQRDRRSLGEGDRLGIVYLRSAPESSWVDGDEPRVFPLWLVPAIAAALLAVAGLLGWTLHREQVLLGEGRFADARIVSTKKVHRQHHHAYRVDYEFTTLGGMKVMSSAEKRRVPAATGATVPIVYHRDNPRWNAIYPLALVTPTSPWPTGASGAAGNPAGTPGGTVSASCRK